VILPRQAPLACRPARAVLGLVAGLLAATCACAQPAIPAAAPSLAPRSLSLPSPAPAGGAWVRIPAAGPDELAYDEEKIVVVGAEVSYWRRVVFAQPQAFRGHAVRAALFREQIHCEEHTLRVLAHAFQATDGTLVEQASFATPEASPVVPDTVGDALWRSLCPRVAQRRGAEERLRATQDRLDSRRRDLEKLRGEVEALEASLAKLRAESGAGDRDAPRTPGRQVP
jgi:polyhydroxyalkanoate synthesis regulator phasin